MQVRVKLFATFREGREKEILMDLEQGSTPKDVVKYLNIPVQDVAIILVNGIHKKLDTVLRNNDTLSLFPPVGGG